MTSRQAPNRRAGDPRGPRMIDRMRALRPGRPAVAGVVVLVLLAALCAFGLTAVAQKTDQEEAAARAAGARYTPPALPAPTLEVAGATIAVVGDGTVSQAGPDVSPDERWPAVMEQDEDVDLTQLASSGSGYLSRGTEGRFAELAQEIPLRADVVIFFGGAADAAEAPEDMTKAITAALDVAEDRAPTARIVMVGPLMRGGVDEAAFTRLRTTLQVAAGTSGATWVDPYAAEWVPLRQREAASTSALRQADEAAIAAKVGAVLKSLPG